MLQVGEELATFTRIEQLLLIRLGIQLLTIGCTKKQLILEVFDLHLLATGLPAMAQGDACEQIVVRHQCGWDEAAEHADVTDDRHQGDAARSSCLGTI